MSLSVLSEHNCGLANRATDNTDTDNTVSGLRRHAAAHSSPVT